MDKREAKSYYREYDTETLKGIEIDRAAEWDLYGVYQRVLDVFLSLISLIIGIPLMVLFGIFIKLDTPGPVFYTQIRLGQNGKEFKIFKLRSMGCNAEKNGAQWADKDDFRITRVGNFIRKTRIDEIPQLFNVIKGDMSIIGPRPERPVFATEFNDEIPGFVNRLQVKPGITGWAQVNGGYDITPKQKLELDMHYIENRCIKLDMLIIVKTIKVVFSGNGAR